MSALSITLLIVLLIGIVMAIHERFFNKENPTDEIKHKYYQDENENF